MLGGPTTKPLPSKSTLSAWRMRLRRWVVPITVVAMLVPNVLAGVYNYHHNKSLIISNLALEAQQKFEQIQSAINLIAYA